MVTLLLVLAAYYTLSNLTYIVLLKFSAQLVHKRSVTPLPTVDSWPKVSVVMAAYNEEQVILKTVESILQNPYPSLELIVINDGSCDQTAHLLRQQFKLRQSQQMDGHVIHMSPEWPNLMVVDTANSGKARSLNLALNFTQGKYVLTLDADTFIEKDAIYRAVQISESNPDCMAVGGTVRILNGAEIDGNGVQKGNLPKEIIPMFQVVEYIRSFFGGRLGWEELGGTALLSGAFSLFRSEELKAVGGFAPNCVTEDFEIVVRMKRHYIMRDQKCEIHMFPNPACWTVVPGTIRDLFWQRVRWQKGLVRTLWRHKALIFNPAFGRMGLFTLPYMLIFEALSPIVELIGYIAVLIGISQNLIPLSYVSVGSVLGLSFYVLITMAAIRLEEMHYARHDTKKPRLRFILFCILENLGYRQFLFVARLWGTITSIRRYPTWGKQGCKLPEEKNVA